jgi:hypothetical protein
MGTITNGKNLAHSDCDGSGTIGAVDMAAIANNYNMIHSFKNSASVVNPQLSIVSDQTLVLNGQWGSASVYLGDNTNPVNSINGVAFTIWFDTTYIATDSVSVTYPNSFINAGQNLDFVKKSFANGKLYCATTHTNNVNVSGNGKIAVFNFKVKQNVYFDTLFYYNVNMASMSDASGNLSSLTTGADTTMINGIDVGIKKQSSENNISIYPNPGNGLFTIKGSSEIKKIEVESISGQTLLKENGKGNVHQLRMENFGAGVYFVKVYNAGNVIALRRIIIEK